VLGSKRLRDRDLAVICEQDILGDRSCAAAAPQAAGNFIAKPPASIRRFVVHVDHGIGRFVGLQTIMAPPRAYCLELHYARTPSLFRRNISCCSRYGRGRRVQLEARRRRLAEPQGETQNRSREMAGELIKIAAGGLLRERRG